MGVQKIDGMPELREDIREHMYDCLPPWLYYRNAPGGPLQMSPRTLQRLAKQKIPGLREHRATHGTQNAAGQLEASELLDFT